MTVTDQLKIIDNKIKVNESHYDLDRLSANISAYSSVGLRKYEYLTGEDLGCKPSAFKQAKFNYSPVGKVFNKGLTEEDKKEGNWKSVKNIEDRSEELLRAINAANKVIKAAKNDSDFNYNCKHAFYRFYRDFTRMSLGSKYEEINYFYTLLSAFIKTHKASTTETKKS